MKVEIFDEAYQELKNNCRYWEDAYRIIEGDIPKRDVIIRNLQGLYMECKNKYVNMAVLTNYALQDFPDKIKKVDLIMCPENTLHRVYNFIKFCKKTLTKLVTNVEALRKTQGVTFKVNL